MRYQGQDPTVTASITARFSQAFSGYNCAEHPSFTSSYVPLRSSISIIPPPLCRYPRLQPILRKRNCLGSPQGFPIYLTQTSHIGYTRLSRDREVPSDTFPSWNAAWSVKSHTTVSKMSDETRKTRGDLRDHGISTSCVLG